MRAGSGFARLVTLENLHAFAPLLQTSRAKERAKPGAEDERSTDTANWGLAKDPKLAAAEALFGGESIKTGVHHSRPKRRRVGSGRKTAGQGSSRELIRSAFGDVLLMRVRRRRNGAQFQVSMRVHNSKFMNNAPEVVSAADGSHRSIGYDRVKRSGQKVENTARFEAPEMKGMTNPVARFSWVETGRNGRMLRYEVFDADNDRKGKRILEILEEGITTPVVTDLNQLGREKTVLSKSDRRIAQWYRLS